MKWLLLLAPLTIAYYTCTYGQWALKNGYKRGGYGVFILVALILVLSLYALYFRPEF